jgi:protein-tyrosine phosphatase
MSSPMYNDEYDQSKPWWDQPKNFGRGYWLKAPYNNLMVGCDPGDGYTKEFAQQFDAVVNVSSTRCTTFEPARPDQRTYWFPIIEMGRWPIVYLLWIKEVLDHHHKLGHKVYLHCHAGAFRSPSAALLWLESRGHTKDESRFLCNERGDGIYRIQTNQGNIPKKKDKVFEMFREQEERIKERGYGTLCIESIMTYDVKDLTDHEVMSGLYRKWHIKREIFWFWYQPKYWLSKKWSRFHDWAFKRYGEIENTRYEREKFWTGMNFAEPRGTRQVGEYSFIPKTGWIKVKEWREINENNRRRHEWVWLVDKCEACDGRGITIDPTKPFGKGHAHCETCKRTGVKL